MRVSDQYLARLCASFETNYTPRPEEKLAFEAKVETTNYVRVLMLGTGTYFEMSPGKCDDSIFVAAYHIGMPTLCNINFEVANIGPHECVNIGTHNWLQAMPRILELVKKWHAYCVKHHGERNPLPAWAA